MIFEVFCDPLKLSYSKLNDWFGIYGLKNKRYQIEQKEASQN